MSRSINLDVAHVWQLDPEHAIPARERPRVCALACMKMVYDFVLPEEAKSVQLGDIYASMVAADARNSARDWQHRDQVDWFKAHGLNSWRRNWYAPSQDPRWLAANESYGTAQLKAISAQIHSEIKLGIKASGHSVITEVLRQSLAQGFPVIVSVATPANHQMVLCGYNGEKEEFSFIDPLLEEGEVRMSAKEFWPIFNQRAIFVAK